MKSSQKSFTFLVFSFLVALCQLSAVMSAGLEQVEHVIIFMQENRPFDQYFGTLKGVRGFNDRTPILLQSGMDAFHQPIDASDLSQYMLPFRTEANQTNAMCMPAPEMYYPTDIKIWNHGRFDSWNTAREAGYGMAYFTRDDLPYYYTLYDHYAVADQYFQSSFTQTNPNRMHLFTGSNGLSVGQPAVVDNTEPTPGYNWTTLGEIFETKGISWRVYQQLDNFDDNAFAWFNTYQQAKAGDALFDKGMARQDDLMAAFKADIESGTLPQVSIVIAPTRKSEHATNHPCAGEDFTARLLQILFNHPDTYAKSVFILNYDEGGQFYDHHWSPTPPIDTTNGYSTVTVEGEINSDVLTSEPAPIGLGFRVPLLIISPWTRGHIVNSEFFDHTSVIQFLEKRFNFVNENLSPWRRLVTGDLLSFFDFDHPDYSLPQNLPDTSKYVELGDKECYTLPDPIIPEVQKMPQQEAGTRVSRALPYQFLVSSEVDLANNKFSITIKNIGTAGAAFIFYDLLNLKTVIPLQYALEAGDEHTTSLPLASKDYAFSLHGPNGFLREFRGTVSTNKDESCASTAALEAQVTYNAAYQELILTVSNDDSTWPTPVKVDVVDNAYALFADQTYSLAKGDRVDQYVNTKTSGNWYDITVSSGCFKRRFMGRMETGQDTVSDPAMDLHLPGWLPAPQEPAHPLPERVRRVKRVEPPSARDNKDARFYPKKEEL
eukprot:gene11446-12800_t